MLTSYTNAEPQAAAWIGDAVFGGTVANFFIYDACCHAVQGMHKAVCLNLSRSSSQKDCELYFPIPHRTLALKVTL